MDELTKIHSLMKRMGENVSGPENMLLYYENARIPVIIEEGLIRSYDTDRVVSFISSAFGFETGKLSINKIRKDLNRIQTENGTIEKIDMSNGCSGIKISVPNDFDKKDKLDYYMKKYGWFVSRIDEEDDDTVSMIYEKKYDESFFCRQLRNYTPYLYHVTDEKNIDSITRKGLKPKSQGNEFGYMHEDRIYLFLNEPDMEDYPFIISSKPVVLKVDLSKINDDIKFYFDPRISNAFYIMEPIGNNAISLI